MAGNDPVALLGLVAIKDFRGPAAYDEYGWPIPGSEGLVDSVPRRPTSFEPVLGRRGARS